MLRHRYEIEGTTHSHKRMMAKDPVERQARKTIEDFGRQWTHYGENPGYYGSVDLLEDFFGPLLSVEDVADKVVLDVGSGTGRIVLMLLNAGAKKAYAVEPSDAFSVMERNTRAFADRIELLKIRGDEIALDEDVDLSISLGVIHHIPDPDPTMERIYKATRAGGRCLIWLYGHEGNALYLAFAKPVRLITKRLPDSVLRALVRLIDLPLIAYMQVCKTFPALHLPFSRYIRNVLIKIDPESRRKTIIFDQLNPAYAKYYREEEARDVMMRAGFVNVKTWHRHGYSWTVLGEKT